MDMEMKFRYESDGQVCELEKVKRKLESEVSEQGGNIENMKSTIDGYCKKVDELESSLKTAENELNEAKYRVVLRVGAGWTRWDHDGTK